MRCLSKVSVIIPNHGRDIQGLLWTINNSTYKNIEIIVVDEGKERSVQRNIGIDRSTGEYLMILDSDHAVTLTLIEDCVKKIKGCVAVYLPERIMTNDWFGKFRDWERKFYTGTVVDCVRFIRRDSCPYYDILQSGPEDSDHDRRIKGKRAISDYDLLHYDNIGFIQYLKKKSYYAKSMGRFIKRNPNDKILNPWYRCCVIFCENGKWRRLVKAPHYTLFLIFLLLLRGVIYLLWKKR